MMSDGAEHEKDTLERLKRSAEKWTAEIMRARAAGDVKALIRAGKGMLRETETIVPELIFADEDAFMAADLDRPFGETTERTEEDDYATISWLTQYAAKVLTDHGHNKAKRRGMLKDDGEPDDSPRVQCARDILSRM